MHIFTNSGATFDPTNPDPDLIRIGDIAHSLSNLCRWTGHSRWFYSVAQHSLLASHLVPSRHRFAVLMHDASEAYVNDLCTPIKHSPQMKWYRDVEQGVQAAIGEHFQIDWKDHAFHIKAADNIMLATEARDLMGSIFLPDDTGLMPERIIPMSQQMAKQEFLRRFNELRGL